MEFLNYLTQDDINVDQDVSNDFTIQSNLKNTSILKKGGKTRIGIISVPDYRSYDAEKTISFLSVRKYLYQLYQYPGFPEIIDFGDIKTGNSLKDTESAIEYVLKELLNLNILPIVLANKQFAYIINDVLLTETNFLSIASIEPMLGLTIDNNAEKSYLERIIFNKSKKLFNYTNIGYQKYFVSHKETELIKKMFFEAYRLGVARENISDVEPILRDAGFVGFDISAIKQSDAPGSITSNPNGFYSEESCQLARFIGLSNRLEVFGLFNFLPDSDINGHTSKLLSQIIWHFIEGFSLRKNDDPERNALKDYLVFHVSVDGVSNDIEFLKHKNSLRWWIKVPQEITHLKKTLYLSCSGNDYQKACKNEVPERFLKLLNRLY